MSGYFPGSTQRIPDKPALDLEDFHGRVLKVQGVDTEMFSLGQLAAALHRKPQTIRKWETLGLVPKATYVKPGKNKDPRGRRRLYSRAQLEGLVLLASETGILDNLNASVSKSGFPQKAFALFRSLAVKR